METTSLVVTTGDHFPTSQVPSSSSMVSYQNPKKRIVVPDRMVNGGFDAKYESDGSLVHLAGLMTAPDYTESMSNLNDQLKKSRSTKLDGVLLVMGPLILPLAIWGVRHSRQTKRRKRLLRDAMQQFNDRHEHLWMHYVKSPTQSILVIEPRPSPDESSQMDVLQPPPTPFDYTNANKQSSSPPPIADTDIVLGYSNTQQLQESLLSKDDEESTFV
eukprot:scaffold83330_cov45-Attheya_sp.AAC.1